MNVLLCSLCLRFHFARTLTVSSFGSRKEFPSALVCFANAFESWTLSLSDFLLRLGDQPSLLRWTNGHMFCLWNVQDGRCQKSQCESFAHCSLVIGGGVREGGVSITNFWCGCCSLVSEKAVHDLADLASAVACHILRFLFLMVILLERAFIPWAGVMSTVCNSFPSVSFSWEETIGIARSLLRSLFLSYESFSLLIFHICEAIRHSSWGLTMQVDDGKRLSKRSLAGYFYFAIKVCAQAWWTLCRLS